MVPNNNPGFWHHGHQNTPIGVISHSRTTPQVPLPPVDSTWGQSRELPQISQRDRLRKERFDEFLISSERSLGERTVATPRKQAIEKASAERPSPLTLSAESSPRPSRLQNLGSRDEALRSHPVRTYVRRPAKELPQVDKRTKDQWRKFTVYQREDDDYIFLTEPATLAKRQRGCVDSLHNPAIWVQAADSTMPGIRLIPPSESGANEANKPPLSVDDSYKILYKQAERKIRKLRRRLKHLESQHGSLVPPARLTAEAGSVDVHDSVALQEALRAIIDEHSDLAKLADILCAHLGIKGGPAAFKALPPALVEILSGLEKA
ncbi:hypothetical protein CIB48_g1041 [Xylaria polymorpha]|nr:hypothetical protein CIB48_g1041 [Xylaria polymorpha]